MCNLEGKNGDFRGQNFANSLYFSLLAGNSRGERLARDCALRQLTRYKALACTQLAPAELRPSTYFQHLEHKWSTIRKSCREQPHRSDCIGRCCLDVMVLRHLHRAVPQNPLDHRIVNAEPIKVRRQPPSKSVPTVPQDPRRGNVLAFPNIAPCPGE